MSAAALEKYATDKSYTIAMNEGYDTGTTDFAPIINKIPADADAVMGGGHFTDGQQFAKALFDKGIKAKFISLLVAPPEPTFAEIGDAAFGIVGPSQWEPLAAFTPDYGPAGADFVSAYKAAYGEDPSYHAAGGYVAGLILQKGIETAGSLDTDAVKAALDGVDMNTFFGHIKFDTSAEKSWSADRSLHGLHPMAEGCKWRVGKASGLARRRQDRGSNLSHQIRFFSWSSPQT